MAPVAPVASRGLPCYPAPWSPVLFLLFLYCWLLVSRGSRGSRGLPWSPVVSRGLPWLPWLPWSPVVSRGLPWLPWSPVVSRFASRGLPLLLWSPVVSQTVNPKSLLFRVLRRQGVIYIYIYASELGAHTRLSFATHPRPTCDAPAIHPRLTRDPPADQSRPTSVSSISSYIKTCLRPF